MNKTKSYDEMVKHCTSKVQKTIDENANLQESISAVVFTIAGWGADNHALHLKKSKWIKGEDELPKMQSFDKAFSTDVLISIKGVWQMNGKENIEYRVTVGRLHVAGSWVGEDNQPIHCWGETVIAWQPMVEPYTEEADE